MLEGTAVSGDGTGMLSDCETGAVRATQTYDVIAGQRAWKLRPNRVTVAPQADERPRCNGRSSTKVSEGAKRGVRITHCECVPASEKVSEEQGSTPRPTHAAGRRLSLRGDHRESEARSFRSDPWAAVRRAGLNPMQPVPDSGDGNPPGFSARNAGKARN